MHKVKLQTSDMEIIEVEVAVARCSPTIRRWKQNQAEEMEEVDENVPVPLHNVNSVILRMVIEWATHHKDDPEEDSDDTEKKSDEISGFDVEFLKVDPGTLFELLLAASYLEINPLLDITCKAVTKLIKGKNPEEIRKNFNIKNDFTPLEEQQIRKENEWCEEK